MPLEILHCLRCKHSWPTKDKKSVKVCPKCKSAYWATPRKNKKSNTNKST